MSDDLIAIEQLLNRYCHRLDRGDVRGVMALFTDDAVLVPEYEGSGEHKGRAAVETWYTRYADTVVAATRGLRHKISNAMIEVDGDRATSVCYLDADSVNPDTGRRTLVGGRYEDELRRDGGTWRISRRRIVIDYATTLTSG
jgi:ketosteroid isomerase-like protein